VCVCVLELESGGAARVDRRGVLAVPGAVAHAMLAQAIAAVRAAVCEHEANVGRVVQNHRALRSLRNDQFERVVANRLLVL
jgi:hypothetical protein